MISLTNLCRVSVGADMLFCMGGCSAVIDTGSSYITGPASSISVLMKTIGAVELAEGGVNFALLETNLWLKPKMKQLLSSFAMSLH